MRNFYLLILLALLTLACQKEEDIEQIEDVNTMTKNTIFTSLISGISKNPTAFDDFIDQNPDTRVEFPFSVTLNNTNTINLNDEGDYQTLIQELENTDIQDEIQIDFPATVSLPDYQSLTVNDATELQNIDWNGFNTSEINCLSINYPIEIISYNNLNIEQEDFEIDSDIELFNFLNNMPNDEFFYQLEYPVTVIVNNNEVDIEDATELENIITDLPQSCFEPLLYDNQPSQGGGGDNDDIEAFTNFITEGTFVVSFLTSDGEEVFEFEDSFFQFDENGNILADDEDADNDFEIVGQWSVTIEDAQIVFELDFDDSFFGEMDDDWQVIDFSNGVTLSLIDESTDGDDDELVLDKL